jgi:OHCU decarboxylase
VGATQLPVTLTIVPIATLNALDRTEFAAALRPLFEAAGPLADGLFAARPFDTYGALVDRAEGLVGKLPRAQQVEVVNAHPRIGESAAVVRQSSELSYREQGYAVEAGLDADEVARVYARLAELNRLYEQRFGFRFVVFVNGRPKAAIVDVLTTRLQGTPDDELRLALHEMIAIARDRLRTLN